MTDVVRLRRLAVGHALRPRTELDTAVQQMGFVQADPIQAPARAQDLILRPRVADYRVGDLEAAYATADYEEDLLYAYGFMPRAVRDLLHPRAPVELTDLERAVLAEVRGPTHPKDLEATLGTQRVRGPWGGTARATKRALDRLHMNGHLRVCGRQRGIRVYAPAQPVEARPIDERFDRLADLMIALFAPIREATLRSVLRRIAKRFSEPRAVAPALRRARDRADALEVDGVTYLTPTDPTPEPRDEVTFLAPFDPLVHDRARFEHLWGWAYRFEAYTPAAKRVRGYYALPVLWRDAVVGWVNIDKTAGEFDAGYVEGEPGDGYPDAFDAEVTRFRAFLGQPTR